MADKMTPRERVMTALDLQEPPNLVVTDKEARKIFRLERDDPDPQPVSSGDKLVQPTGIVVDSTGDYLVCDQGERTEDSITPGAIIRVDPTDGSQRIAAIGGFLVQPAAAVLDDQGFLIVADAGLAFEGPKG